MHAICQCCWIFARPPLVLICFSCHLSKLCYLVKTELFLSVHTSNHKEDAAQCGYPRTHKFSLSFSLSLSLSLSVSLSLPYYQSDFGASDSLVCLSYRLIK